MDVNKDPPLQAVTQPSTAAAQQETVKRNRKRTKNPKCLQGRPRRSSTDGGGPSHNRLTAGGDRGGGGVKQVCVYSLEVDSAAVKAGS